MIGLVAMAMLEPTMDWLLDPTPREARVYQTPLSATLSNGIVTRTWRKVDDSVGCYSLRCESSGEEFVRSIRPEAQVTIDGTVHSIGGLVGQPVHNYVLPEWLEGMRAPKSAFRLAGIDSGPIRSRFDWEPRQEWLSRKAQWPPKGAEIVLRFVGREGTEEVGVEIDIHVELYDGLPLFGKWFEMRSSREVSLDGFAAEILACVEAESEVEFDPSPGLPNLHVETDFTTCAMTGSSSQREVVRWLPDPTYGTQVNYRLLTPCLLEVRAPLGPAQTVGPGRPFRSIQTFELVHDSTDEARRTLVLCRLYRTLAPWSQENPLIFHCRSAEPKDVRAAIDQAAATGFELVIMTFGSGFDIENDSPAYLAQIKELADYAHSKGVALGGYSLLASRSIDAENDVVNPETGKPGGFATFGNSPCVESRWGQAYFAKLRKFFETTGCDVLEHDGSYPGDACASTTHPGHKGYADSRWNQWRTVTEFYRWCRGRGIYLNVPDWYFLSGSSKTGMGYRETNWSLPREQQEIIERQNIFDGTRYKTPTMGWMFVPLTEYHGGGPAATIEPLKDHLDHYRRRLQNLLGAGVQACFRGPRLYDSPETEAMVKQWVGWFKAHRRILESDIVPLRRPDGRDWDGILHVDPFGKERALAALYNPLDRDIARQIRLPLAYAGLDREALVSVDGGKARRVELNGCQEALVEVRLPAKGFVYMLVHAER
jgi:hypothetical protein